jgi:hypothetical protein
VSLLVSLLLSGRSVMDMFSIEYASNASVETVEDEHASFNSIGSFKEGGDGVGCSGCVSGGGEDTEEGDGTRAL